MSLFREVDGVCREEQHNLLNHAGLIENVSLNTTACIRKKERKNILRESTYVKIIFLEQMRCCCRHEGFTKIVRAPKSLCILEHCRHMFGKTKLTNTRDLWKFNSLQFVFLIRALAKFGW